MLWQTIVLVTKQIEKYGAIRPLVAIGDADNSSVTDYDRVVETQKQEARHVRLSQRPLAHIDPHYITLNPSSGGPPVDRLDEVFHENFGTAVVSNVLEHVPDPKAFFEKLYKAMKPDSLVFIESAFVAPYLPGGRDLWRFSPECLRFLGEQSGFTVLESGWLLDIPAGRGVINPENNSPQEIKVTYVTLAKGTPSASSRSALALPERIPDGKTTLHSDMEPLPVAEERFGNSEVADKEAAPTCVFLDTCYEGFLDSLYKSSPELLHAPYETQKNAIILSNFGDSDFYSRGLRNCGWKAENLIINCSPLQSAWARENHCEKSAAALLIEQIDRAAPQVVYIQDMHLFSAEFLALIKSKSGLLVGQIASSPDNLPFTCYDIIISSIPPFVDYFRSQGITSYYQPLAFDERVLSSIPHFAYGERPIEVSFVGSLSSGAHKDRFDLLQHLAQHTPIEFWGLGADSLPQDSPIRQRWRGEAWGNRMFEVLGQSKITVNVHAAHVLPCSDSPMSSAAKHYANNMRLFEATGCGSLLITDFKDNLCDLFEPGKEVVAYRSADECEALIKYYLAHPDKAAKIARAGQERTLKQHAYALRLKHTAEILERHLFYKELEQRLQQPDLSKISYGHTPIRFEQIDSSLTDSWKNPQMSIKQRELVQQELMRMYRGERVVPYQAMAEMLAPIVDEASSILEVGCSSGYYYEVIEYLLKRRISYTGVDYSPAMIEMAQSFYPAASFVAADGACMPFADRQFEVAISSCVLLHTPNYLEHMKETHRVAAKYILAHRTPVSRLKPLRHVKKFAYGVETVELVFNEQQFVNDFESFGCRLVRTLVVDANSEQDHYTTSYLFERTQ
ncbi:MAG: glycosyltransferase [Deltaproteobacteria bacterium]|nr:glycosyltransferase [Deltaproteobacteria bacterium]